VNEAIIGLPVHPLIDENKKEEIEKEKEMTMQVQEWNVS